MAIRGGKREGAGRPPLSPELKRIRVDVRLTQSEIDWLRWIGDGNLSKGIRAVIQEHLGSPD